MEKGGGGDQAVVEREENKTGNKNKSECPQNKV